LAAHERIAYKRQVCAAQDNNVGSTTGKSRPGK
jgi:hypothetical protein